MAVGYTRNDTSNNIANGNVINASDLDGEFDAIQSAYDATTGHNHDGTTGGGAPVSILGPAQDVVITTSVIRPKTDNTVDLGTSTLEFKDLFIDGTAQVDTLQVDENATVTGNLTVNGNTTIGNLNTDTVTVTAQVASSVVPSVDNTYDLGSTTKEWKDLWITGTANIDSLVADTADINAGTIDGTTIATSDITVGAGKTLNVSAGTLTLADNQISGDKVEGGTVNAITINTLSSTTGNITSVNATTVDTANLEVTALKARDGTAAGSIADVTGIVTLPSSVLTTTDINGGTIDGTTIATSDITVGTGKTLNVSAGTLTLANDQISGDKVEGGTINAITITTLGSTTGNITNVNATTVDTTNIEVTNLKAKDGTTAGSIADTTGVVTIASSVLTTTDINGGTLDGVVIGGASAAAGTFTSLDASSPSVISVNSASDALRITQTGAGNALVVEDAANPDSSPFVVNIAGNVGVGTASPARALHVKNTAPFIRLEDTDTAVSTIYGEINSNTEGSLTLSADPGNATALSIISFNVDGTERARFNSTGAFLLGTTVATDRTLSVSKAITGATNAFGVINNGEVQSDVTLTAHMYRTQPTVAAAAFTLPNLLHYSASQGTIGAGATVTTQSGYFVDATLIGAGTNVGFNFNGIAAASVTTGKFVFGLNSNQAIATGGGTAYNIYAQGTAPNYLAGTTGIGRTPNAFETLSVGKNMTGSTTAYGIRNDGAIQSDVTAAAFMNRTIPSVADAAFTLTSLYHYAAAQGTFGASATVTNQVGYLVEASLIGAAKNVGFQVNAVTAANVTTGKTVRVMESGQNIATGGGTAHNLYIGGSAPSYFQGNVGLGTDAPARALHVKNTSGHIRLENTSATAYGEITTGGVGEVILSADPANAGASSAIVFQIDGTERFRMGQNGGLSIGGSFGTTGQALISGGGSANTWGPVLTNGTYTPTLTAVTNVAASTSSSCQWMRVGSTVTVSGVISVTATTANTDTHLGISLPIASNIALTTNLGGTGASVTGGTLGQSGGLDGDTTNDRARFLLRPTVASGINYSFSFTYQVI